MSILNKALAALDADYQKRHQECAGHIAQAEEVLHKVLALFDKIARECGFDFAQVNYKVCLFDRNGSNFNPAVWHSVNPDLPAFMKEMKDQAAQRVKDKGVIGRFHFMASLSLPPIRNTEIIFKYRTFSVEEDATSVLTASVRKAAGNTKLKLFPWTAEVEMIDAFISSQDMQPLYAFLCSTLPPLELDF